MKPVLILTFASLVIGGTAFLFSKQSADPAFDQPRPSTGQPEIFETSEAETVDRIIRDDVPSSSPVVLQELAPSDWWDDTELVKDLTNRFAEKFPEFSTFFFVEADSKETGDLTLKLTREGWGRLDPKLQPSDRMFENLTQGEKWVAGQMIQTAAHYAKNNRQEIPSWLSASEQVEYMKKLQDEALYYPPEFILEDKFGPDWNQHPELADRVREYWIEMVNLAAPLETQLNVRQRCAASLLPTIQKGEVRFIVPDLGEYEFGMQALHQEFYGGVSDIITSYRNSL